MYQHIRRALFFTAVTSIFAATSSYAFKYVELTPSISTGAVIASGNPTRFEWKAGLSASGNIYKELGLEANGSYAAYKIKYLLLSHIRDGNIWNLTSAPSNEKRYDYGANFFYPVWKDGVKVDLKLGYRGLSVDNSVTSFEGGGVYAGVSAQKEFDSGTIESRTGISKITNPKISNHLYIKDGYQMKGSNSISVHGDPKYIIDYSVIYWLPVDLKWVKSGVAFDGEALAFQHTKRFYNGFQLLFKF
jgi:hypothetical protein